MNRRTLLGRFATIAAAVAVAPAVTVEAAPSQAEVDALYVKAYGQEKVDSWAPTVTIEALLREAGCPDGCTLRYFGEMQTQPQYLWRHENYDGGRIIGGDIRVDAFDMRHSSRGSVWTENHIVRELRRHHGLT